MKQTVVPAQVTTVEDRIAGNLSFSQLMLLIAPVFLGTALYFLMPPLGKVEIYKFVLVGLLFIVFSSLSIRIRNKIVLSWILVLARYNSRPRYYVFNKQATYARGLANKEAVVEEEQKTELKQEPIRQRLALSHAEMFHLKGILDNPAANLRFENKKGNLYVRITEVK